MSAFISHCPQENMERCAFVRAHYKEIICTNVEYSDKDSTDKSGNMLLGAFTGIEI